MKTQGTNERGSAVSSSIDKTMQRVENLLDRETEALLSRQPIDLKESNNGKSRALLELSLAARLLEGIRIDPELARRLKALRGKLEANQAVLRRHLEAVREVANVVAETIQDVEWDGTYSQQVGPGGGYR
jgi:hypothetical protein